MSRPCSSNTRLNLNAQLEYRGAFSSQVAAMFINDAGWVIFRALFFTRLPVEALRSLSLRHAAMSLAGSLAILAIGVIFFYHGLRRYESGNVMEMRG